MDKTKIAKQFISAIPHSRALGMELTDISDSYARIEMPYSESLVGDPETGVIHGGAVSAPVSYTHLTLPTILLV